MSYFIQKIKKYNNDTIYMPLGSENQIIINDLKTLRGVLKRINNYTCKIDNYIIYRYNNIFEDFTKNQIVYTFFTDNDIKKLYIEEAWHDKI